MSFSELAKDRFSVRNFKDIPVNQADILMHHWHLSLVMII